MLTLPDSKFQIPNSKILIFIIGMPAVGKTYWGEKIAKAYGLHFVDLDDYIAGKEKASIPALFAQYGEAGFRERENKQLKKLISGINEGTVVASGGGTPCYHSNMELMKKAGAVIYLQADVAWLLGNLKDDPEIRPLLKGRGDLATYLETLLQKRKPFYEQAHYILQTKDISLTTFAEIISGCINKP